VNSSNKLSINSFGVKTKKYSAGTFKRMHIEPLSCNKSSKWRIDKLRSLIRKELFLISKITCTVKTFLNLKRKKLRNLKKAVKREESINQRVYRNLI
jgi:hypothetical protein